MEELAEYEVEQHEEQDGFVVDNDEKASYCLRKLKGIVTQQLSNQRVADKETERIDRWLKDANSKLEYSANIYRQLLMDYMRRERDKRKSISLPYGTIKSTATQPKYIPDDEFIDWAKVNARHLLRFKDAPPPAPDMAAIKEAFKAGQKIEHVEVVEGGVSFSVEVS